MNCNRGNVPKAMVAYNSRSYQMLTDKLNANSTRLTYLSSLFQW